MRPGCLPTCGPILQFAAAQAPAVWTAAVQAADAHGNTYTTSPGAGDVFTFVFTSTTPQVVASLSAVPTDSGDGTFALDIASAFGAAFFPAPGTYTIDATYGGADISGSPLTGVAVAALATDPAQSMVSQTWEVVWGGDGVSPTSVDTSVVAVAGETTTLFVATFDTSGSPQVYSDGTRIVTDAVTAVRSWSGTALTGVYWAAMGVYNVSFTLPSNTLSNVPAAATVAVKVNGVVVGTYSLTTYPGPPAAAQVAGALGVCALEGLFGDGRDTSCRGPRAAAS